MLTSHILFEGGARVFLMTELTWIDLFKSSTFLICRFSPVRTICAGRTSSVWNEVSCVKSRWYVIFLAKYS